MLPNCTVLSTFTRGDKVYVTLELDLKDSNNIIGTTDPRISIGDFRIEATRNGANIKISFYYGNFHIGSWNVHLPENVCINLGSVSFSYGVGIKAKNIQVCLENGRVCLKAAIYVEAPIVGEQKIDDIKICSSPILSTDDSPHIEHTVCK
ncbi:hypothetical protein [Bacillus toyonensis]|uniref:hypothetical protein n=1 Tax=Bacillus toyonensis TaxID=155322 RepID=UPI000BEE2FD2|nr:hypothetical protein [Bacillus toyonensis]PEE81747.1 hypothetical protein COO15_15950 [Bacillus toyonensis]